MEQPLTQVGWEEFFAAAAATLASDSAAPAELLGSVVLMPHQRDAVLRLEHSMAQHGGALLADDVGLGKTFVALAIAARTTGRCVVAAPASLLDMWKHSAQRARVQVSVVSLEALGSGHTSVPECDLLIVDEAHFLRNPRAQRYERVAAVATRARLLLLSATPVHNSESDLRALLALFIGARADEMDAGDLASIVVRRERSVLPAAGQTPEVLHAPSPTLPEQDDILDALLSLPPPLAPADGGDGGALTIFTLVRQWSSSSSALRRALQRRLVRGVAMQSALENGVLPREAELRSWCAADEVVQLPFFGLLEVAAPGARSVEVRALLGAVAKHLEGVRRVAALLIKTGSRVDDARWNAVEEIVRAHPGEKVIAFTQFEQTARALFKRSLRSGRSAMLTAAHSMVASGRMSRGELISLFAPRANGRSHVPDSCVVDLLFCTDLLSEGANMQDASVVIHLDLPWTPVRLTQRVGRVARLGSRASHVTVYTLPPPASAELLLRMERRLSAKLSVAARTVGIAGTVLPILQLPAPSTTSVPQSASRVRSLLRELASVAQGESLRDTPFVSAVDYAGAAGEANASFIALLEGAGCQMVVGLPGGVDDRVSTLSAVLQVLQGQKEAGTLVTHPADACDVQRAVNQLNAWAATCEARAAAGIPSAAYARARKQLIRRIDTIALRAPAHSRPALHEVVARVRQVATAPYGHGAERVLAELASAQMTDDAWLRAIEVFGVAQNNPASVSREEPGNKTMRIKAILLLLRPGTDKRPVL